MTRLIIACARLQAVIKNFLTFFNANIIIVWIIWVRLTFLFSGFSTSTSIWNFCHPLSPFLYSYAILIRTVIWAWTTIKTIGTTRTIISLQWDQQAQWWYKGWTLVSTTIVRWSPACKQLLISHNHQYRRGHPHNQWHIQNILLRSHIRKGHKLLKTGKTSLQMCRPRPEKLRGLCLLKLPLKPCLLCILKSKLWFYCR